MGRLGNSPERSGTPQSTAEFPIDKPPQHPIFFRDDPLRRDVA
ncbi:MAG: hypothetical protein UHN93_02665 [Alistipes sp.]|nr:hypothetical protein [Alistipes sp.]